MEERMRTIILILSLLPVISFAEGISCPSTNSDFDIYLCQSYQIADLDKQLNKLYKAALKKQNSSIKAAYSMQLQTEQQQWLKSRDLCLSKERSHECLVKAYSSKINDLKSMLPAESNDYQTTTNTGVFSTQQIEYSAWSSRNEDSSFQWPWQNVKRHYFRKKSGACE